MANSNAGNLVSIVIPIRDSAAFLADCCNSVKAQTYLNWEAILIDDNSSDESAQIANYYVTLDSRFRLITSGRLKGDSPGPWLPRNQGLKVARGKYVAFLDADDLWLPDKLKYQLNLLETGEYDFCVCPYFRFSDQTRSITELRRPATAHMPILLNFINPIPLSAVIIRRELMPGFRAVCHEDHDAWCRLFAARSIRYANCDQALVAYRLHQKNLTGSWWRKLQMRLAQQKGASSVKSAITLPVFLLIHGLYLLQSIPWRIQRSSIDAMGFDIAPSIHIRPEAHPACEM